MTEKKESPQLDQPGERVEGALPTGGEGALPTSGEGTLPAGGEGVLPTGVVKAICISDIRGIEKGPLRKGISWWISESKGMPMAATGTVR